MHLTRVLQKTKHMSLLQVSNLATYFHTRDGVIKAVDDINFHVDHGETLGIVGESGSGKSVACYSLLGLIPVPPGKIESGSALFEGSDLLACNEKQLRKIRGDRIAMIFQDPMTSLNPYMRIGDQIIESLRAHKNVNQQEAKKCAIDALNEVGISDAKRCIDEFPHQFSGGMRQRVMIAMALISEPELLIADEPTTALDVTVQAQILELILNIQKKRRLSVIFVTHDLGVIARIADRVLVMQSGKIVESGSTDKIFHHHEHPYTKSLLEAIPTTAKPIQTNTEMNNTLLSINNLSTHYKLHDNSLLRSTNKYLKAVDDVSITVRQGEILGLVGESGSGKSTLGRSIIRLVDSHAGEVIFSGIDILKLSNNELYKARKHWQMIFQDPYASLNPRMTVFDTLAEPLLVHRITSRVDVATQINKLMDDVGLARHYVRKYPHEFSGGQRQRIAIARALAVKPKLIIADEPVSALDVTIQAQILDLLLKLTQEHALTMIFISHDLSVIRYISDRVAVMYKGKIIETNDTEALFNMPQHSYTQTLLSAITVPDPKHKRLMNTNP